VLHNHALQINIYLLTYLLTVCWYLCQTNKRSDSVGLQEVKGIHCSPRWTHFLFSNLCISLFVIGYRWHSVLVKL